MAVHIETPDTEAAYVLHGAARGSVADEIYPVIRA